MRKFKLADLPAICKDILTGKSLRKIAGDYRCSPSTVHEYRGILKKEGITYEKLLTISLDELIRKVCPSAGRITVTNNSVRVVNRRCRRDAKGESKEIWPVFTVIANKLIREKTRIWNEWVD